jgi:16S rRNA (uracil1498-N3)-methyltransferase
LEQLAGEELLAAVGPEGGFTEDEISSLAATGWQCLDLGARLLRIETAAIGIAGKWLL